MRELFFRNLDGINLHAVVAGKASNLVPLVCLPGLTRSTRDFAPVFERFSQDREIIAFDFRGRGKSDHASDPTTYTPMVECADTIAFLDHLKISKFAIIGTSRGGIVAMLMASLHFGRLAGLLLNDIGCKIEPSGLKRIIGYVGKPVMFSDWNQAAQALQWSGVGFENMAHDEWIEAAKMIFAVDFDRPCTDHDPLLNVNLPTVESIDAEGVADLWDFVPALQNFPLSLLHGKGSDLLSRETVLRMQKEIPNLKAYEIRDRGHVPFLNEPESVTAISQWLATVDANEKEIP